MQQHGLFPHHLLTGKLRRYVLLSRTDHPNVVKLHETFEDRSQMYLAWSLVLGLQACRRKCPPCEEHQPEVMELCAGGDLDKHMKGQGCPYSEHQARQACSETALCLHSMTPRCFLFGSLAIVKVRILRILSLYMLVRAVPQSVSMTAYTAFLTSCLACMSDAGVKICRLCRHMSWRLLS